MSAAGAGVDSRCSVSPQPRRVARASVDKFLECPAEGS